MTPNWFEKPEYKKYLVERFLKREISEEDLRAGLTEIGLDPDEVLREVYGNNAME